MKSHQELIDAIGENYYQTANLWQLSGVPERHAKSVEVRENTDDQAWKYAYDTITEKLGTGFTCGIEGPIGSGKTQVITCIARRACELSATTLYVKAPMLLTYHLGPTTSDLIARSFSNRLLVLDNVEPMNPVQASTFNNLIDYRYARLLDTIVVVSSTDTDEDDGLDFGQIVGPAVMDRIAETGKILKLTNSHRRPHAEI